MVGPLRVGPSPYMFGSAIIFPMLIRYFNYFISMQYSQAAIEDAWIVGN